MRVLLILLLFLAGCAQATPDPGLIQTAIAGTAAAAPTETKPPAPTSTPRPTSTPAPTKTATAIESIETVREEACQVISDALLETLEQDVGLITLCRFSETAWEFELRTEHHSEDSQPDVSYKAILVLAELFGDFGLQRMQSLTGTTIPKFKIVTYSADGDYRYESITDYDVLRAVGKNQLSYAEWVAASGAGFK